MKPNELPVYPSNETEILKRAIVALIDVEMGIFPAAFVGKYEKRSDYQEGWNACYTAYIDKMIKVLDELGVHVSNDDTVTVTLPTSESSPGIKIVPDKPTSQNNP